MLAIPHFFKGLLVLFVLFLHVIALSQEKGRPLSVEFIEDWLKEGLPQTRLVRLLEEQGVTFEVTDEIRNGFKRAGAEARVMQAVEKAALEFHISLLPYLSVTV